MKICDELRQAVLQAAIQGKLTRQRQEDGDAHIELSNIVKFVGKNKPSKVDLNLSVMDFEIPDNWIFTEINQIFKFVDYRGKTPHKIQGGVFLVTASNIKTGYMDYTRKEYISEEEFADRQSRGITEYGDLLFTTEAPMGNVAICDLEKCSCGQRIITLKQYVPNVLCNKLFMYFIMSPCFQKQLEDNCTGTTAKGIKGEKFKNLLITLPPLAEQQRIVAKVEKLMAEIDELEKIENELIALKEAFPGDMKAALLQAAMQGKLTTQRKEDGNAKDLLKKITEEKARLVKEGKLKKEKPLAEISEDEIPFDIPENWEWVYVGDIFQHNTGKALNSSVKEGVEKEYITTSNLYWNRFELDKLKKMPFTDTEIDKCTIKKGDLLVCEGGDYGRAAIWNYEFEMRIQNHIHRLRPYLAICIKYFYYIFYFYKQVGMIGGKGIGIQGLSSNALHKIVIPLPPLAEQERIVAKLDKLLPLCESLVEA